MTDELKIRMIPEYESVEFLGRICRRRHGSILVPGSGKWLTEGASLDHGWLSAAAITAIGRLHHVLSLPR